MQHPSTRTALVPFLALIAWGLCACSGSSSGGGTVILPEGSIQSSELAILGGVLSATERHALFRVSEGSQGGLDLNGDGDAFDDVMHLLELDSGSARNLGVRAQGQLLTESHMVLQINEIEELRDVNGDASFNSLLLVEDLVTGAQIYHVLEANVLQPAPLFHEGAWVMVPRASDNALAIDLFTGERVDLGFTVLSFAPGIGGLASERVVFVTGEVGEDLNGDTDTEDVVVVVFDLRTKLSRVLPYSLLGADLQLHGDLLSFRAFEAAGFGGDPSAGEDLNGDGDREDLVSVLVNLETDERFILPGEAAGFPLARLTGDFAAVLVREKDEDLNGDGVIEMPGNEDSSLHVVDLVAGAVRNLGFSIHPEAHISETHLVFAVDERRQGGADLNGDGDADDFVAHVHDLLSGETRSLGVEIHPFCFCALQLLGSDLVILAGPAGSAPGCSDNADGSSDPVPGPSQGEGRLLAFDLARGTRRDLGFRPTNLLPVSGADAASSKVAFVLPIGEGSELSFETHVYDVLTRRTTNLRVQSFDLRVFGSSLVGSAEEFGQGDLNGDGDLMDRVVFTGQL